MAKVAPIFKGENILFGENYRLMSVLPTLSGILKGIMYNGIYRYFK